MYREPRPMRQIHKIQEKIHEEMKSLPNKEKIEFIHKEAEETKKRLGLEFKKSVAST